MADAIVKLIMQDEGVSTVFRAHRNEPVALVPLECAGCGETFLPAAFGRQYCSRPCYDEYLARQRAANGRPRKKPPEERDPEVLGPGRRVPKEVINFILSRHRKVNVSDIIAEVHSRFGFRLGITTVYRVFKRGNVT